MKLINRQQYLDTLQRLQGTPDIKIITGMRRVGKSELLRAWAQYLKAHDATVNIISIDFADLHFDELKHYKALFNYIEAHFKADVNNVVMVDEVQLCPQFELAINSLHNAHKYDIYITGSNAFLLSGDLATLFTGRFIEVEVFPFSFAEYCTYFSITDDYSHHLEAYLKAGGLAGSYVYSNQKDAVTYIKEIYQTSIKRDLLDRYRIADAALLDMIAEFLLDNIANLTTVHAISKVLKSGYGNSSHVTVANYIKYLCNAFMFYKVKRYDIQGKRYLSTIDKYFVVDTSLRYAMLGARNMDYGRAYENIVALELLRRGYDIYVGKLYQQEVDFIALRCSEKLYIQVADSISNDATLARELAPLQSIKDSYRKIVLANTHHDSYDIQGIEVLDIAKWLLG